MKLRNKVSIILFAIWCVAVTVAYFGSQLILNRSYLDLENKQVNVSMQRIDEAIDQSLSSLATILATWAAWDDTYQYAVDRNQNYIKANMVPGSLASINIDDIMIYNKSGDLIFTISVDAERNRQIKTSTHLIEYISPKIKRMTDKGSDITIKGLANIAGKLVMLVAQPIMTSNNTGPSHGTIVMIKHFNNQVIGKIRDVTKINLDIYDTNEIKQLLDLKTAYVNLIGDKAHLLERSKEDSITGFSLLNDAFGNPVALIKSTMPRSVYLYGKQTISYYNKAFIIYCTLLIALLWILLQKLLVKRLERLKQQVGNIDENNHYFNNLISGMSDEVSSVASLYHQATHDPLTGLANRNLLEQAFNNSLPHVNASHGQIAILFLDIDYFKRINDTLGHEVGDQLLIEISHKLNSCLRENDLAVRLGGDEFVVMLVNVDLQDINTIIDRIYQSFAKPIYVNEHELYPSSSMGVSLYPNDSTNITSLLKNADIALYHAKENGRNNFQYYSIELNKAIQETYRKEAELQHAIDNKELSLFYQPIYDVHTGKLICLEALLRWRHPQRGLLSGADIIPLAEKSGLILPIGKWVLSTACQQAKKWQDSGLPAVPIAVNISIMQTKHSSFNQLVTSILQETGLDPHLLELELTETSYVDITESILDDMRLLKRSGVSLVVDDFGVGYSGLGYLRSLPVTKLKIDRSFIADVLSDPDASAITLAIIAIAHQLDLQVTAEGVETIAHYDFLKMHHVDAAQGNYFSKPLDVAGCEKMLKEHGRETAL